MIVYFVSKGTVIFCLDKKYGEKEIKEIKKSNIYILCNNILCYVDNNFGEIEMCLNEKLSFNIKIKSRNCELFALKKNDFLRLSVNFKEFIENFLHKSLMKYLKFNEEKNKMIKDFETLMAKCNGNQNAQDNKSVKSGSANNDLQAIEEENDEIENEERGSQNLLSPNNSDNDDDDNNNNNNNSQRSNKDNEKGTAKKHTFKLLPH